MAIRQRNSCAPTPNFSTHRYLVAAVDSANPTDAHLGVLADSFQYAILAVAVAGGATSVGLEILYFNDAADAFTSALSAETYTVTTNVVIKIEPRGMRFFVKVTSINAGTVTVMVAGFNRQIQLS